MKKGNPAQRNEEQMSLRKAQELEIAGHWAEAIKVLSPLRGHRQAQELLERLEEKRDIYKKVSSVLTGRKKKTYIGKDDLVTLSSSGISIRFHVKNRRLNLEEIFRAMKRAKMLLQEKLDVPPPEVVVEIFNTPSELRRETNPTGPWVAGLYDGKIRVYANDEEAPEPQRLYVILSHEYVHLVVRVISQGRAPFWLDEGLAICFSQELTQNYLERLLRAEKAGALLPLETLEKDFSSFKDEELRALAYAQSGSIVEYLLERQGWKKMGEILQAAAKSSPGDVLRALNLTYYLLEQDWKRWLKGKNVLP